MPTWFDDILEIKSIIQGSLKSTAIISALISSGVALINGFLLRRQNRELKRAISDDVKDQIKNDFYRQNIHLESERKVLEDSVKNSLDGMSEDQYLVHQIRWINTATDVFNNINSAFNDLLLHKEETYQIVYLNAVNTLLSLLYEEDDKEVRLELEALSKEIIAHLDDEDAIQLQAIQGEFNRVVSKLLSNKKTQLRV